MYIVQFNDRSSPDGGRNEAKKPLADKIFTVEYQNNEYTFVKQYNIHVEKMDTAFMSYEA